MSRGNSLRELRRILTKAHDSQTLSKIDITFLLGLNKERHTDELFQAARDVRKNQFGEKIFFYGFLYVSTFCRNDCSFCFFRKSNKACNRYRKEVPEIIEAACQLADSGVHLIDLTMGEDPEYLYHSASGFDKLVTLVESVKGATGLPIMISPGVVPDRVLSKLMGVGVTWYACYQETHQRALFNQLRPGQSYDARLGKKLLAHRLGLLIEEGILSGVGESYADVGESISIMRSLDTDQMRVMSFVPQKGTPMGNWAPPNTQRELLIIAVMRLAFPDRLISASLDVAGLAGLKQRLDAGANVVTSLVPPGQGFAGVAQSLLDIENAKRTSASILPVLETCGLSPGSTREYLSWIEGRRKECSYRGYGEKTVCF